MYETRAALLSLTLSRPPTLSSRYTRVTMPLDVSTEVRIAGGEILAREIARLDEDGWNVDEQLYPATSCRAHGRLNLLLDETLELTLGDVEGLTRGRVRYVAISLPAISTDLYQPLAREAC